MRLEKEKEENHTYVLRPTSSTEHGKDSELGIIMFYEREGDSGVRLNRIQISITRCL